ITVLMTTYVAFHDREQQATTIGPTAYQMPGLWMMGFRAGLGFIVAVVAGLLVEWMYRKDGDSLLTALAADRSTPANNDEDNGDTIPVTKRIGNMTETALHDFVDITVFLIVGALIAGFAKVLISPDQIAEMSKGQPILAIAVMMTFAVVVTL